MLGKLELGYIYYQMHHSSNRGAPHPSLPKYFWLVLLIILAVIDAVLRA